MDFSFDEENDLSSALGTETLAAGDMAPEGFDNTTRAHVPTRYYPIRKVVYYQAIHRPAGRPVGITDQRKTSKIFLNKAWMDKPKT
jgi:hypothetical protein